jgi:protein-disulfide isomerase
MAAEASVCAQDQEKFWEYHDVLFENMQALEDDDLKRYAGEVGLDVAAFEKCLTERKFSGKVQDDLLAGRKAGVTGTPAFVINGIVLTGAKPVDDFVSVIEAELERQRSGEQS